jgi:hypothetical protein
MERRPLPPPLLPLLLMRHGQRLEMSLLAADQSAQVTPSAAFT